MDEEAFCILVTEYPNLYDLSHPKYHDNLMKENSWEEISVKINCSGKFYNNIICYFFNRISQI